MKRPKKGSTSKLKPSKSWLSSIKLSKNPSKTALVFAAILLLAVFLRVYKLDTRMPFFSDQGRDFLAARDMIITREIPLLGIPSSVPRFKQGPLYVWLLAGALSIGNFHPFAAAFMATMLSIASIIATYLLAKKFFNPQTALLTALILATSVFAVTNGRLAYHTNALPLTSAIYLYLILNSSKKIKHLLLTAFAFALMFQFELVVAPLILLIPLNFYLTRTRPTLKHLLHITLGLTLGLLPQIIYDLTHNFEQVGVFVVWIGYRIASFFGIFEEHATSPGKLSSVVKITANYLTRFYSWSLPLLTPILILFATAGTYLNKASNLNRKHLVVFAWIGLQLLSFLILGNASEAYFPSLFVPLALALAILITNSKPLIKYALIILVLINSIHASRFLVRHNFLTGPRLPGNQFSTYGPPMIEQLQIVDLVESKTNSQTLNLKGYGPGSHFDSFLDNYKYLLWWQYRITHSTQGPTVWFGPASYPTKPYNAATYPFDTYSVSLGLE